MKTLRIWITAILIAAILSVSIERARAIALYVCAGAAVLVGGIYVTIKMRNFCQRHLTPPPAPPVPPPVPGTNAPGTNAPPTNSPSRRVALVLEDEAYKAYDISVYATNGTWFDPDGAPYHTMIILELEISTNLVNWSPSLCVTGFLSQDYFLTSTANGASVKPHSEGEPLLDLGLPEERCRFLRAVNRQ